MYLVALYSTFSIGSETISVNISQWRMPKIHHQSRPQSIKSLIMKKLSFLPSILLILTIMTLGLTSCSRKYGCYYSHTQELKIRSDMESYKWISTTEAAFIDETMDNNNFTSTTQE
jgi:hypothetical protein